MSGTTSGDIYLVWCLWLANNRQHQQQISNPFKNDLFENCIKYVQTIFRIKGLAVTGVKNLITGTLHSLTLHEEPELGMGVSKNNIVRDGKRSIST